MATVDVKLIGRWSHDINLGHTSKWNDEDLQTLIDNGCRISQTGYVLAPIEVLEGTLPFGFDDRGSPSLVLNETVSIVMVKGKNEMNSLEALWT